MIKESSKTSTKDSLRSQKSDPIRKYKISMIYNKRKIQFVEEVSEFAICLKTIENKAKLTFNLPNEFLVYYYTDKEKQLAVISNTDVLKEMFKEGQQNSSFFNIFKQKETEYLIYVDKFKDFVKKLSPESQTNILKRFLFEKIKQNSKFDSSDFSSEVELKKTRDLLVKCNLPNSQIDEINAYISHKILIEVEVSGIENKSSQLSRSSEISQISSVSNNAESDANFLSQNFQNMFDQKARKVMKYDGMNSSESPSFMTLNQRSGFDAKMLISEPARPVCFPSEYSSITEKQDMQSFQDNEGKYLHMNNDSFIHDPAYKKQVIVDDLNTEPNEKKPYLSRHKSTNTKIKSLRIFEEDDSRLQYAKRQKDSLLGNSESCEFPGSYPQLQTFQSSYNSTGNSQNESFRLQNVEIPNQEALSFKELVKIDKVDMMPIKEIRTLDIHDDELMEEISKQSQTKYKKSAPTKTINKAIEKKQVKDETNEGVLSKIWSAVKSPNSKPKATETNVQSKKRDLPMKSSVQGFQKKQEAYHGFE